MQRYFIETHENVIFGDDYFHIKQVMRMKKDDQIEVCRFGTCELVKITEISDQVHFEVIKKLAINKPNAHVTLIQGLGKSDKQEIVTKYATQFGVSEIIFVPMKRSIATYDNKDIDKKIDRYRKIALESSRLAHRDDVPRITYHKKLEDIKFNQKHRLIAYEAEQQTVLVNAIKNLKKDDSIALFIGPEGGIDEKEILYLYSLGFVSVSLGKRILQTEIACLYALSVIDAFLDDANENI